MVVTGFEVFGAVSGAIGTLNLVRQLVVSIRTVAKNWKDSGPNVLEIHDGFDTFIVRLETWSVRTWSIDAQFSDEVGKAFWGEPGWRSIALQLGYIEKAAQDFLVVFTKAVDPAVIAQLQPKHESAFAKVEETVPGNWHDSTGLSMRRGDSVRKLRDMGTELTTNISPIRKAKIVIERSATLLDMLASLNARFLLLERDANAFFEVQHPMAARYASQQQRLSAAESSMLFQNTKATKAASEALYRACSSFTNKGHTFEHSQVGKGQSKLEMNLLATEVQSRSTAYPGSLEMRFHLVLNSPEFENEIEVLVEGPLHNPVSTVTAPLRQTQLAVDFAQACRYIGPQSHHYFQADLDIASETANVFRLSSPFEPLRPCETKSIHLFTLLESVQRMTSFQASAQFPCTEKLNLAFKVTECGLLLIGTSWLSSVDSRNIQRLSDSLWKAKRRFILEVNVTENEHLDSVEPHIFKIGKLLAEIAMGLPVKQIATYNGNNGPELDLVISVQVGEEQEMRAIPAVEVEQRVRQAMGTSYSKAVAFCLQQSPQARKENWAKLTDLRTWEEKEGAYLKILTDYYTEVYLP
jgi:hypothetical protein